MSEHTTSYSGDNPREKLPFVHNPYFAVGLLIVGLLLTIGAWYLSNHYLHKQATDRFKYRSRAIHENVTLRMQNYLQVINSSAAWFSSSDYVSRDDWKNYIKTIDLENNFSGIQALGFSYRIPNGQVDSLENKMRSEWHPDFKVYHTNPAPENHAIIYIDPDNARNRAALGYNMFSEENRRKAMSYAQDNETAGISRKVILVQETDHDIQTGFLIYYPIYKKPFPTTVEERRKNLKGFVYGAFRINDLMEQILTSRPKDIEFSIYDGKEVDPEHLLFNSSGDAVYTAENGFSAIEYINIAGHTWTIVFNANDLFLSRIHYMQPLLIALAGIAVEIILFYLIWTSHAVNKNNQRLKTKAENIANRLRIALSAANMGTWELNLKKGTSVRSIEHDKLFGYNELQPNWSFDNILNHIMPKHRPIVENSYKHALKSGKLKFECQLNPEMVKEERWIYVEGETTFNFRNKPVRMNGIVMDITERKKAEQAIRESEERFRYIADATPVMIWMTNKEGYITYYNKTLKDFVGSANEDVIKSGDWSEIIHSHDLEDVNNTFFSALKKQEPFVIEYRLKRKDGNYLWFSASGVPRFTSGGEFLGFAGSSYNLHDRKLAEESLKQKQQMLESSNEDLNTFIYTVSHDIKNPLTALILHTQLAEEYSTIDEYKSFMEMVGRKSEKIQEIIDVMSNVIREENKDKNIEHINLKEEVKDVLSDFEELINESKASVNIALEVEEIRYIRGYIRSILQNLIGNAIKYRSEERVLNIEITTTRNENYVVLNVKDNGIGIDMNNEGKKLFKPFHRVSGKQATTPAGRQGSGLGLFIIKRMIQKNGGNIKVSSEPGKGTIFTCYLNEY